jgi:hypothetical protein
MCCDVELAGDALVALSRILLTIDTNRLRSLRPIDEKLRLSYRSGHHFPDFLTAPNIS